MSESKTFIKNAVGLLIVVAVCFVAVMIYRKGNASINHSLSDYDEILAQFDNVRLKSFENSTASGSQVVDLIQTLREDDGIRIQVTNGYCVEKKIDAKEYSYSAVFAKDSTVLTDISDRSKEAYYINPNASFRSGVVYDENGVITAVVFIQR